MLSETAIKEFRELYHKKYDRELSGDEAREMAEHFFGLYCAVYGPSTPGKINDKNENNGGCRENL